MEITQRQLNELKNIKLIAENFSERLGQDLSWIQILNMKNNAISLNERINDLINEIENT